VARTGSTKARSARNRMGAAAAVTVTAAAVFIPGSAWAAASAAPASCGHTWEGGVGLGTGGQAYAEWTVNGCPNGITYAIQVRAWCELGDGSGQWATSGVVKRVFVVDGAHCSSSAYSVTGGEYRINKGNGWSTYQSY
jgi:hypothetical protein